MLSWPEWERSSLANRFVKRCLTSWLVFSLSMGIKESSYRAHKFTLKITILRSPIPLSSTTNNLGVSSTNTSRTSSSSATRSSLTEEKRTLKNSSSSSTPAWGPDSFLKIYSIISRRGSCWITPIGQCSTWHPSSLNNSSCSLLTRPSARRTTSEASKS